MKTFCNVLSNFTTRRRKIAQLKKLETLVARVGALAMIEDSSWVLFDVLQCQIRARLSSPPRAVGLEQCYLMIISSRSDHVELIRNPKWNKWPTNSPKTQHTTKFFFNFIVEHCHRHTASSLLRAHEKNHKLDSLHCYATRVVRPKHIFHVHKQQLSSAQVRANFSRLFHVVYLPLLQICK